MLLLLGRHFGGQHRVEEGAVAELLLGGLLEERRQEWCDAGEPEMLAVGREPIEDRRRRVRGAALAALAARAAKRS